MIKPSARFWGLVLEGTAIVVSILLAFAIDAWWEDRQEREVETKALAMLLVEFEQNLQELQANRETHERALAATDKLLNRTGPDQSALVVTPDIGLELDACLTNGAIDPRLGAISSLISSGDLRLIEDKELQIMLTEWPFAINNIFEWQRIERDYTEGVLLPFTYDFVAWPDIDVDLGLADRESLFDSDYAGLFASIRFEGMLSNRRYNLRWFIEEIENLEDKTKQIIDKLSQLD